MKIDEELRGILKEVAPVEVAETSAPLPTEYDSTMHTSTNCGEKLSINIVYNREVRRYAKKHNISEEEAFKKIYKR